jgi:hypothetical protein
MSLAVPLRLTVLFRLPRRRRVTPAPSAIQARPIDPCAMSPYLRRDIGLQDFPCLSSSRDLLRYP